MESLEKQIAILAKQITDYLGEGNLEAIAQAGGNVNDPNAFAKRVVRVTAENLMADGHKNMPDPAKLQNYLTSALIVVRQQLPQEVL
jgi:hypothetical protein